MVKRFALLAALLAALLTTHAAPLRAEWLLALPAQEVRPGAELDIIVLRTEASDLPLPDTLPIDLAAGSTRTPLTARANDSAGSAHAPLRRYVLQLPNPLATDKERTFRLALPGGHSLLLALDSETTAPFRDDGVAALATAGRLAGAPSPALSGYEPTYFLLGRRDTTSARFQFSFKYRLFDDDSAVVRWLPPLYGLHFAYSQTSLWDLTGESKPFRDTSYRPALIYHWQGGAPVGDQRAWRLYAGVEHESNGRDEARSRSINIAFVHPEWRFPFAQRRYAGLGIKLFGYLDREENDDITRYRGHANLQLLLGKEDGWLWRSTIRRGSAGVGSIQNELSYPLRRPFFADTGGYVFLQHFNGFGETLLDYNVRRAGQLRIGFAIVR